MEQGIGQQSFRRKKMTKQLTGKRDDNFLHSAARAGDLAAVKEILAEIRGDDARDLLRKQNQSGETALYVASEYGYADLVFEMIKHYDVFSAGIKARNGFDPLHIAVRQGDVDVLKVLLETIPELSMTADSMNTTALHTASTLGNIEIMNMLLAVNKNLTQISRSNGKNALHSAARNGHLQAVKILLTEDPSMASRSDKKGQTALHMAVKGQNLEIVDELLRSNPSLINSVDSKGNTPLHIAVMKNRDQAVKLLLQSEEMNSGIKNRTGDTALDISEKLGHNHITEILISHGCRRSRDVGGATNPAATELNQTVKNIKNDVHSQLEHTVQTGKRVRVIARRINKLQTEGLNNAINSTTVVAVLIATIAFAAIFTVPGEFAGGENPVPIGSSPGEANIAHEAAFIIFLVSDSIALFISLAVVVVQTSLVVVDRRAKKKVMKVISKLMWVSCSLISVSFLAVCFLVMGRKGRWMATAVSAVGAAIMAVTLGTLSCWGAVHRGKTRRLSRQRSSLLRPGSLSISETEELSSEFKLYPI